MVDLQDRGVAGRRLAPALAVAVGLIGGAAAATAATDSRAGAADAQSSADAIEIIELRSDLRRVHLHETNVLMLDLFGAVSSLEIERARDERIAVRDEARERARELSLGQGVTATEALFLYDLLSTDGLQGEREADPSVLFDVGRAAARDSRPPDDQLDDEILALYDLMRTDAAAGQVLNDAMDAEYTAEQPEVPELMADYVSRSEPYIRSDGGYLGPDPARPLIDSYVYDSTATTPHPALADVEARIADSELWTYDQWIRSWQEGTPGPAPLTLEQLVAEVDAVDRGVRAIVDEALGEARRVHTNRADDLRTRAALAFVALALFGATALGGVAVFVRRRWHAARRAADRLTRDPLTGVGNRHALDEVVVPATRQPGYGWHLVAAVDMDRFKMINDTWGHAVGDRVLVEVARRLSAIVDGWRASGGGISGSVIRLGGDEFLLTLHAKSPLDELVIRRQLEDIRTAHVPVFDAPLDPSTVERDEERQVVGLMFSVGVATAGGPCELDDLVRSADLAAYEEKAARAASLPDRRRPSHADDRTSIESSTADSAG